MYVILCDVVLIKIQLVDVNPVLEFALYFYIILQFHGRDLNNFHFIVMD